MTSVVREPRARWAAGEQQSRRPQGRSLTFQTREVARLLRRQAGGLRPAGPSQPEVVRARGVFTSSTIAASALGVCRDGASQSSRAADPNAPWRGRAEC
jgi:hypothetical protein